MATLKILSAVYGLKVVTEEVIKLINQATDLQTLSFLVNNQILGVDTWVGQKKSLTIVYQYDGGAIQVATAKEGDVIAIGEDQYNKSKLLPVPSDTFAESIIVYGASYGLADVTEKVRSMAEPGSTLSVTADNATFGDGWPGVPKTLVIVVGLAYEVQSINIYPERQSGTIDLFFKMPDYTPPSSLS